MKSNPNSKWLSSLLCAVSACWLSAQAQAQSNGYASPELGGRFWAAAISSQVERQYLAAEINGSNRPVIVRIPVTNLPAAGAPWY